MPGTRSAAAPPKSAVRCSVCADPDVAKIDKARRGGRTVRAVAEQFGISRSALDRHNRHARARSVEVTLPPTRRRPPAASSQPAPADAPAPTPAIAEPSSPTALPRARSRAEYVSALERCLQDAVIRLAEPTEELSEVERSKLRTEALAQYAQLQKLEGHTQFSEKRILRSVGWQRVKAAIVETLKPWPEARRALADALRELGDQEGAA